MEKAFSLDSGLLKVNECKTDKNEQKGVKDLSCGVVAAFRNILSHESESEFLVSTIECLEYLSIFSYLFRKLDLAYSIELDNQLKTE